MFGQRANRDEIHACFGKFAQRFMGDIARDFQTRLAVCAFYRFAHLVGFEVIEHDDVGSGFQRVVQLIQAFYFDFNRHIWVQPECFFYGLTYRAGSNNVVFFNQESVGQPQTMIRTAAAQYGVF